MEYVQENDLTCDGAMTDPKGDRSLPPHQQPDLVLAIEGCKTCCADLGSFKDGCDSQTAADAFQPVTLLGLRHHPGTLDTIVKL